MAEKLTGLKRTHMCGEVSDLDVGHEIVVMGWVQRRRELGKLIFVDLRDRTGILQIVFKSELDSELHSKALQLRNEYVIAVRGVLQIREDINPNLKTGKWEVVAKELRILSKADTPPIHIEDVVDTSEATRLKYRYLDLRRPVMQKNLMLRHRVAKVARDYFDEKGFIEIETPVLIKSTPEGARDYLVPSRVFPGKFFALPQSPQLFKQILMVSGFDRYFQIAKCFRDEDLRADRQPEFTQIDLEMSFVDIPDVLEVCEGFLKRVYGEVLGIDIDIPFPRMTYAEAMERFGSDKPDTRFGMELVNVSDIVKNSAFKVFSGAIENGGSVRAINAKGCGSKFSRKEIDALTDVVKTYGAKGMAWIAVEDGNLRSSFTKFLTDEEIHGILKRVQAEPGDLICFVADSDSIVFDALGHLRLEIAKKLNLLDENKNNFLWVTEFPLLEYDDEEKRWVAKHHPFTSPMDEDIPLLDTDPGKVRAKAYDIVLNGIELGGGSIRIHDQELQKKIFNVIGISDEEAQRRFGFLLEAFRYGTPPHGGLAFGLDRMVMLMAKCDSIRDVIAFPKVQNSSCLMTGAPDFVDEKQLEELHIRTVIPEDEK
ncbi:aspartate--tRNA ligase AspS [Thermoclostridium stercorarium subsp. stercorarium DSM 8532]|uniref:Aspartate--tRNA ligase n=2 Tax=Thermoclostridium stercorarium TaxID=1510 RepID=L7VM35_THES1|nr:aspartate--tRNA ligase [Thermoclostridium stercorarium]AGC67679.1 aspartate--tRNA ligase AspS [Thermoclostridium stercorarium subsp. stercorarium DSM 8532]AGI38726.1 aspartyl-tRNA synthetase [Thermoclostridium stercorarium subsp. stercorarium DSM 8532]ANW98096.1 aspartate--tRNA ligase [Thermoclostridium stercorarium subsp. thermolacticum DSM 2910]UZQ86250.1 aspartate--tRNA ligase [Thermoclostridium stercorarium]